MSQLRTQLDQLTGRSQNDQNPRQTTGTTSAPRERDPETIIPITRAPNRIPTITVAARETPRDAFTTPGQPMPEVNPSEPPLAPPRHQEPNPGTNVSALEGVVPELPPSEFVAKNFESLTSLLREEAKRRSNQSIQARLSFDSELEASPPPSRRERRERNTRRTPVFNRIGERREDSEPEDRQYRSGSETSGRRRSVHDRIGGRRTQERLRGQRYSPSESPSSSNSSGSRRSRRKRRTPPSSDSEDSRRDNRKRRSPSSSNSSDNEEKETGHWKSRRRHRSRGDEDISRPWRRQKIDAFTRRISDFSENKRRRLPTNVKTYDGTGDPDDHLKVFESAAAIENWPQPVWCHMFNSTLVGNARTWFSKLPRRSIDGYETMRKAFRLNFTQRKKCAKNPVDLARIRQRQGESTSAFVERFKDECIQFKACPEILKISAFMNGVNNPELIKKLHDGVPLTFDEVMKRTRSFIQGETAAADSKKGYPTYKSQDQSRKQSNDQGSSQNRSYRNERNKRGNDKYTPLTKTPGEIFATEGANFPKPPAMRTPEDKRTGNGFCDYHGQKGHTTNERERTKAGKKDTSKDKPGTIFMIQSWDRNTKQKVTQCFSRGNKISFPSLTVDNAIAEPLIIEIQAGGHDIHRMYVDGGASADIMYEHCFNRLRPDIKRQLNPATMSLTGFAGEKIWPIGQIRLPVTLGSDEHSTTTWVNFMVIRSHSPYNGIIGRPGISALRAVPSTAHGMMKFPVEGGIVTLYNNTAPPGECNAVTSDTTPAPALLNIRQGYTPIRQKKRGQAPERAKAIPEEVHKLVDAGIMREVFYHDWLSNPVMVKKSDGSWRMCVDFTDLNKACSQDCYPLPEIDWKVESLCGYPFKCFLDAYKGYHQIQMAEEDEEKTAFHTSQGVFCYTKMPFGLKNAGATYQRLVDNAFEKQVGRNLEVYVDDLVIKSHTEEEIVRDIEETFSTLRKINMKLNPKKCTFGATEGMFLGYLIEPDGIKV
ncbi:retroelement [Artemisia annua]|uniref:Retroelement n=1 Tax=Artemisia annua TaxID=35608 RepID=A0A2U1PF03_ARTAN|nr:retroelement [Artemisia annua]